MTVPMIITFALWHSHIYLESTWKPPISSWSVRSEQSPHDSDVQTSVVTLSLYTWRTVTSCSLCAVLSSHHVFLMCSSVIMCFFCAVLSSHHVFLMCSSVIMCFFCAVLSSCVSSVQSCHHIMCFFCAVLSSCVSCVQSCHHVFLMCSPVIMRFLYAVLSSCVSYVQSCSPRVPYLEACHRVFLVYVENCHHHVFLLFRRATRRRGAWCRTCLLRSVAWSPRRNARWRPSWCPSELELYLISGYTWIVTSIQKFG